MTKDIFYFQDSEIPDLISGIPYYIFAPLRDGIKLGKVVAIRYRDSAGESTEREILPVVFFCYDDTWYLAAFCYLRNDKRTFRFDCIEEAELTGRKDQSDDIADDIRKNGVSWFAQPAQNIPDHSESIKNGSGSWAELEVVAWGENLKFHVFNNCPGVHYEKTSKDFSFDLIRHSEHGDIEKMKEDIAAGAEINFKVAKGATAMTGAARYGKLDAVKFLVEQGGNAHITDGCGSTALITASRNGNMDLVRYLLEELHADINHRDRFGWSPLYCAVLDNHPDLVRYYLKHGADVNIRDRDKKTTLMLCFESIFLAAEEALTLAEILIQGGADLEAQDKNGSTALFYAIEKGNDKAIEFLLNSGASMEIRDKKGNTALLYALQRFNCKFGFHSLQTRAREVGESARLFAVGQDFLSRGADANAANNEGVTPLMLAKGKLLHCLLLHGANAAAVTKDRTSVAMHHPNSLHSLRLLEEYGADITAPNRWGDDVLLLAHPSYRLVRYLIEKYGFSTNDKNNRNETILHRACENSDVRLVKYLMEHGANQNVKDMQGKTPLEYLDDKSYHCSAFEDDYEIMDYLYECQEQETENLFNACREFDLPRIKHAVEYGASVKRVKERRTTVMTVMAAQFECRKDISADVFSDVVRFLQKAGADINAVDMDGNCVLSALIKRHEVELLQEFLSNGADPNIRSHSEEFSSLLKEALSEQEMFKRDHNGKTSPQLTRMLDVLKAHGAN